MNAQEKKFNITFFKNGEKMLDTKLKAFVPVTGEIPPEGKNSRLCAWDLDICRIVSNSDIDIQYSSSNSEI